jgi:hypothetical protein
MATLPRYVRRGRQRVPLEERFWPKVDKHGPIPEHRPELGPCWVWLAACDPHGYGLIGLGGGDGGHGRAHRVAHELLVGPIPKGLEPDHLCRVHPCVKAIADEFGPAHLELVTRRENLLRGETIAAQHAAKTHCPQGHPYDEVNTYMCRNTRQCRQCSRDKARRYYYANRDKLNAQDRADRARKRAKRS